MARSGLRPAVLACVRHAAVERGSAASGPVAALDDRPDRARLVAGDVRPERGGRFAPDRVALSRRARAPDRWTSAIHDWVAHRLQQGSGPQSVRCTESGDPDSGLPHQPQNRNHPRMSSGRTDRNAGPITSYKASVVRAADFRTVFTFDHNSSIGVRSELYGGNGTNSAPAFSICGFTSTSWCGLRLSQITTSPGCNGGASTCAT